jgi:redox-sensitive bicupin YhaK (pirin superfamily)
VQGFQLWLALPPEFETAQPQSRYIESHDIPQAGPAHVVVGAYANVQSPVPAWPGVNYLVVTLRPGKALTYQPQAGHSVAWMAVAAGEATSGSAIRAGEMVVFENGEVPIDIRNTGATDTVFVLGSAVPHGHDLHLGNYSVHTSAQALKAGERRIVDLHRTMMALGDRSTASGTVPVYQ